MTEDKNKYGKVSRQRSSNRLQAEPRQEFRQLLYSIWRWL